MKRIKILLLAFLLLIPFSNIYAAGVNISTTKMSITVGKSATFKISASSAAGRVDISSSDSSVAKVSSSSEFLDNSSVTIKVTAKKEGTAKITIKLSDIATYSGQELTGSKTINVTVKKAATKTETNNTNNVKSADKKEDIVKEMKITSFKIVGYDIEFNKELLEYTIDVSPEVNKLYIIVKGENFTISGDKEVDITNKDSVVVTLKNGQEVYNYTIKINRKANEVIKTETKEVIKEVVKTNNMYLYSTIGLSALCLVLIIVLIKSKSKTNSTVIEKDITPIQTTHINTDNNDIYASIPNNTLTNTTVNPVNTQDNNLQ